MGATGQGTIGPPALRDPVALPEDIAPESPDFMAPPILSTAAIWPLESIAVKSAQLMSSADIWANAGEISTPDKIVINSSVLTFHLRSVVVPSGPPSITNHS
jgi:hypothetical protein